MSRGVAGRWCGSCCRLDGCGCFGVVAGHCCICYVLPLLKRTPVCRQVQNKNQWPTVYVYINLFSHFLLMLSSHVVLVLCAKVFRNAC